MDIAGLGGDEQRPAGVLPQQRALCAPGLADRVERIAGRTLSLLPGWQDLAKYRVVDCAGLNAIDQGSGGAELELGIRVHPGGVQLRG